MLTTVIIPTLQMVRLTHREVAEHKVAREWCQPRWVVCLDPILSRCHLWPSLPSGHI